jgi:YaiO family outer membrane protein
MRRAGIVAFVLLAALPAPSRAQAPGRAWSAGVFYDGDYFPEASPEWADWSAMRALVQRRVGTATLGVELATVRRFEARDQNVAAEAYVVLWGQAYAHVRGSVTPDAHVLPLSDWRLTLYQGLPGAWEASGSLALLNVPGSDVTIAGLGVARYVRQWYLQGRATVADVGGERAGAASLAARRLLGEGTEYLQASAGWGREMVVLGLGPVVDARSTWFVALTAQRFVTEVFGVHVSAGLNDFEGVPRRRSLTVGLLARY